MEILILKNGHVYARASDPSVTSEDTYSVAYVTDMPEYPTEDAGKGKFWDLDYVDGNLEWAAKDRPLTSDERIEELEERVEKLTYPQWVQPTGAHDAYAVGAKVSHNGKHWISAMENNVWEPGAYGWEEAE